MSGKLYEVAADAVETACKKCYEPIYFVTTENGAKMPVDCEVPGGRAPTLGYSGVGVSHFETCPYAKYFSGRNAKK